MLWLERCPYFYEALAPLCGGIKHYINTYELLLSCFVFISRHIAEVFLTFENTNSYTYTHPFSGMLQNNLLDMVYNI